MGIQDRDYWRNRYNRMTGHKGRIDPTHWREDELGHFDLGMRKASAEFSVEKTLHAFTKMIIFLAILGAFAFGIRAWLQYQAVKQLEALAMQSQADLRRYQQIAAEKALDAPNKLQAKKDAEQSQLAQRNAQLELAQRSARSEADWRDRKDAAWLRYYKPSPSCQRDAATVDCANEHIRARRKFDEQYRG